ncbi:unnamed protein product [Arctogadus glacialis]
MESVSIGEAHLEVVLLPDICPMCSAEGALQQGALPPAELHLADTIENHMNGTGSRDRPGRPLAGITSEWRCIGSFSCSH